MMISNFSAATPSCSTISSTTAVRFSASLYDGRITETSVPTVAPSALPSSIGLSWTDVTLRKRRRLQPGDPGFLELGGGQEADLHLRVATDTGVVRRQLAQPFHLRHVE